MRLVYVAIALGLLLTAAAGVVRLIVSDLALTFLSEELFKGGLAFSLVAATGAIVKVVAERFLDAERATRARAAEREKSRHALIQEFTSIYSEFYSLRKLWHSARSKRNAIFEKPDSAQYRSLIRRILEDSVALEGRFGALKIEAVAHFGLRTGDWGKKTASKLETEISGCSDPLEAIRLQLDLLGELYDDWRHALEEDRKIRPGESLWTTYEALLKRPVPPPPPPVPPPPPPPARRGNDRWAHPLDQQLVRGVEAAGADGR